MSLFNGEFTQEDEEGGITKAKAKPCNCNAYKDEHNLDDPNCRMLYNDDIDENPDDGYCANCSGSGEGSHDGTRCIVCKGSGVAK